MAVKYSRYYLKIGQYWVYDSNWLNEMGSVQPHITDEFSMAWSFGSLEEVQEFVEKYKSELLLACKERKIDLPWSLVEQVIVETMIETPYTIAIM